MGGTGETTPVATARPKDCFGCRLVGGVGMTGIGLYLGYNGFLRTGYSRTGLLCLAGGAIGLGMARILNIQPFENSQWD